MTYTYDGGDTAIMSLVDQLNASANGIGMPPNGAYPQRAQPFTPSLQMVSGGVVLNQADSSGKYGQGIFVPSGLPTNIPASVLLYTGLTTSTSPPSTTDLPSNGSWGWHLNTSDNSFYWAYNNAGTILLPTGPPTAVIIQREVNSRTGGNVNGQQAVGTGTSGLAHHFYSRRLTNLASNYMECVVPGSFVAANGGGGTAQTNVASWDLLPGVYAIHFDGTYCLDTSSANPTLMGGLFNETGGAFEVHMPPSEPATTPSPPVVFSPVVDVGSAARNFTATFDAIISVSAQTTYSIRHQCDTATAANSFTFCGAPYADATAQVNSVAPPHNFCSIRITKLA